MTDVKLPVRMDADGTDWVPAWRLREYQAAVDALDALLKAYYGPGDRYEWEMKVAIAARAAAVAPRPTGGNA